MTAAKISMSPLLTEQNRSIQKYVNSFQKAYGLKLWAEYKQTEIQYGNAIDVLK